MSSDVVIRVPASTRHLALVRATATAVAALLDFTYDRLTDLHIALDEVCSRVLATSDPPARRLEVRFRLEGPSLRIEVSGDSRLRDGEEFLTSWSRAILDAVTDRVEVATKDGVASAAFEVPAG